jgi:membrane protein
LPNDVRDQIHDDPKAPDSATFFANVFFACHARVSLENPLLAFGFIISLGSSGLVEAFKSSSRVFAMGAAIQTLSKQYSGWRRHWARARLVLSQALISFFQEDSLTVSASIAYHAILSLFPLMLLLIGLSGAFISRFDLSERLAIVLGRYLPMNPDFILKNLASISHTFGRVTLVSFLLLLWSSAGVFLPLEKALNRAWDVEKGRNWLRSHFVALEMAVVLGVLIAVLTALASLNIYVHQWFQSRIFHHTSLPLNLIYNTGFILVTFGLTLAMFLALFQRLPNHPLRVREVFPGAALTALFWEAARSLFTLLLPHFNYRHIYGSIGAMVALMTWAYISSAVLLFGAQVSNALYRTLKEDEVREAAELKPAVPSPATIQ